MGEMNRIKHNTSTSFLKFPKNQKVSKAFRNNELARFWTVKQN